MNLYVVGRRMNPRNHTWDKLDFEWSFKSMAIDLIEAPPVDTGHWQALKNVPQTKTRELQNVVLEYPMPELVLTLQEELKPNLPWAEDHFLERTSGEPLNPGEQYKNWPWYRGNVDTHRVEGEKEKQFSHSYMERYWPRYAGEDADDRGLMPKEITGNVGIRYRYGDLDDVVNLLSREPTTRQAYLPVWFPEDTGSHHGQRVPCSLGYHFLLREGRLHCNYFIRSCDLLRHFRDDVYLTARLTQWVIDCLAYQDIPDNQPPHEKLPWAWEGVTPGTLTMFMSSLHVFEGDLPKLRREYGE